MAVTKVVVIKQQNFQLDIQLCPLTIFLNIQRELGCHFNIKRHFIMCLN